MLSRREVEQAIRGLLGKYNADYAILFAPREIYRGHDVQSLAKRDAAEADAQGC